MKTFVALSLMVLAFVASAAPTVVSDSTTFTPKPTHCGWYMDAAAKEVLPVTLDASGNPYCSRDMAGTANGSHTMKATFIIKDAAWGDRESAQSPPFTFVVPAAPGAAPSALRLVTK